MNSERPGAEQHLCHLEQAIRRVARLAGHLANTGERPSEQPLGLFEPLCVDCFPALIKGIKAIAVRGTGSVSLADPAAFMKAVWTMRGRMQDNPGRISFTELGTAATIDMTQAFGGLPTRNFLEGQFEHYENLNGTTIKETRMVANKACFACTIACGRVTRLGEHAGKFLVNTHPRNWKAAGEGPEYENAWALGADVGVGDLDAVLKANWLCNDLGMDPISMGASLAAAMELYERGVITETQVERPLRFGSADALVRMVEATAYREGFGDLLAGSWHSHRHAEIALYVLVLADQHVEDHAIDRVGAVIGHDPNFGLWLAEPVHPTLALLVSGRVPRQVVMHHRIEPVLQVDALR